MASETLNPEHEWAQWQQWLGAKPEGKTIKGQVVDMLYLRQIWEGFAYIHDHAPDAAPEEGTFLWWVRSCYGRSQALAVRRMADTDPKVISLARLLQRVTTHSEILTRERFTAMQESIGNIAENEAEMLFNSVAGPGGYIDPAIPAQDLESLQNKTKAVRDWVNKNVAHVDPRGKPLGEERLSVIHAAVDVVADLFDRYNALIQGERLHSGVVITSNWPTVFRVPWIGEEQYLEVLDKVDEAEARRGQRPAHQRSVPGLLLRKAEGAEFDDVMAFAVKTWTNVNRPEPFATDTYVVAGVLNPERCLCLITNDSWHARREVEDHRAWIREGTRWPSGESPADKDYDDAATMAYSRPFPDAPSPLDVKPPLRPAC
jgi:hypothetical protein